MEVVVEVLEGPPADAILSVVQVRECDLIVMGSLLLGSVSYRMLAHAPVPVTVVRAREAETG